MKRKIRAWVRRWVPKLISLFETKDQKGKWFEKTYYTYLFTRNENYSRSEPNPEERERWLHIKHLVEVALASAGKNSFDQILDFGCGRGWLSKELTAFGHVTGIEPIEKVVAYGRKIYPGLDLKPGGLQTVDAICAELIVCSEVVEHLGKRNLDQYFSKFYNALKPGCFLIITTPRAEVFKEWAHDVDLDQPTEEWLLEDELRHVAEAAGFKVIARQTYGARPKPSVSELEVYQQWLFQKPFSFSPSL